MNFSEGQVVYHKATNKKCVVIKTNEDGTVKVRNQDDEEKDYFPVELEERRHGSVRLGRARNLY